MNEHEILDGNVLEENYDIDEQHIISVGKFAALCFLSLGIYVIWWQYKAWKFFKQKEKSDIMPVPRAIFGIIFLIPLLNRIQDMANEKGYSNSYNSVLLYVGLILTNLLSRLPEPIGLISVFAFLFLIPPFKALNFAKEHSNSFKVTQQDGFNGRQIFLIVFGLLFWGLILYGLTLDPYEYDY